MWSNSHMNDVSALDCGSGVRDWFDVDNSITYRGLWNGRIITWNASIDRHLSFGPTGLEIGGTAYSYESIQRITASPVSPISSGWVQTVLQYIGRGLIRENSDLFDIPFPDRGSVRINTIGERKSHLRIGGINGVNTSWDQALSHANYLRQFSLGKSIEWTHNRSHTLLVDLAEIVHLNYQGYSPTNAHILLENWIAFHKENESRPHAKYLQIAHSQGALHVRNALLQATPEVRNRVIVVAIAPAGVVPNAYCYRAFNYAIEGDWIPAYESVHAYQLYRQGLMTEREYKTIMERRKELVILPRDPHATGSAHDFEGVSFKDILERRIKEYLSQNEKYQ
jgi:hypothetical protein